MCFNKDFLLAFLFKEYHFLKLRAVNTIKSNVLDLSDEGALQINEKSANKFI